MRVTIEPLVGPRLDFVEDGTERLALFGESVVRGDRGVLLDPATHKGHVLKIVEHAREGARTCVGRALELVEPLLAVLEVVQHH